MLQLIRPGRRRLTPARLLGECLSAIVARPARTALTALGTVLGVAAIVTTLGVAQSGSEQIRRELDALRPTMFTVSARPAGQGGVVATLPDDAGDRIARLNGVVASTVLTEVRIDPAAGLRPGGDATPVRMFIVSTSFLEAVDGDIAHGVFLDAVHDRGGHPVAVLGPLTADRLGIGPVGTQPAVFIGDVALSVIGVLADENLPDGVADSILVTPGTARTLFEWGSNDRMLVRAQVGAVDQVAAEVGVALAPDDPAGIAVVVPPEPTQVRSAVEDQLNVLVLALGGVALAIGGLGIANVSLVSVLERTSEIGIRKALGARRGQIALQFMVESVLIGFIGGVVGTSVGVLVVALVAAGRDWVPVLEPWIMLAAPLCGVVVGLLAGLYPASRAARMEAAEAIRSGDR